MGLRLVDLYVAMLAECLFACKISIAVAAVEFWGGSGRFLILISRPRVDGMVLQTLVLHHALLVIKEDFTLNAKAVFSSHLMLSKSFYILETLPTRAAHVSVKSGTVLLQGFCGSEELVTDLAIAVLAGNLMRSKMFRIAERHPTIMAPK